MQLRTLTWASFLFFLRLGCKADDSILWSMGSPNQYAVSGEGSTASSLRFLLLGDWGKGGSTGQYGSAVENDTLDANYDMDFVRLDKNDKNANDKANDKNNNKDNGKKQKVLYQVPVAKAMAQFANASNPKPSFVVSLGDNFYANGVSSATDVLWQYLWRDIYLPYPQLNITWFPVFGNHDYGGGASYVQAQLQRTRQFPNDVWQFPSTNYTKIFTIPGQGGATVQIVFIDSTTLAPSINKCCNENGGVSQDEQKRRIVNQLRHINDMLNTTLVGENGTSYRPTWVLVAGHYPIFSAGPNGDSLELQTYLLPLLQHYRVHAYLCGHDHISEHLQYNDMEFFVAGAGSMTDQLGGGSNLAKLRWSGTSYSAFAYVDATPTSLTVGYVDINGTLKYNYTLYNPNPLPDWIDSPDPPGPHPPNDKGKGSSGKEDDGDSFLPSMDDQSETVMVYIGGGVIVLGAAGMLVYFFWDRSAKPRKRKVAKSKKFDSCPNHDVEAGIAGSPGQRHRPHGIDSRCAIATAAYPVGAAAATHRLGKGKYSDLRSKTPEPLVQAPACPMNIHPSIAAVLKDEDTRSPSDQDEDSDFCTQDHTSTSADEDFFLEQAIMDPSLLADDVSDAASEHAVHSPKGRGPGHRRSLTCPM